MKKSKLVILSTYFPPYNHIASRRIYAFASYLSDFFDVTVITYTENKSYNENNEKFSIIYLDNGFLDSFVKLKDNDIKLNRFLKIALRKILILMNKSFFFIWKKKAKNTLRSYLNNNEVDFLLSSYMPIEAHEISYEVLTSSEKYNNIFWIADMRDEMSEHTSLNDHQKKYYKNLELLYSKRVNLVTAVSKPILNQFKRNMPNTANFLEIRNGYDHSVITHHEYTHKLRIGYFGNFYADRKPTNFFEALSKCEFLEDIEIFIASNIHNYNIPKKLVSIVKQSDFLPYEKSIVMMGSMDCNLLILPYKGSGEGVYSGKLFDYLSSCRPILGLINEQDVAAELIKEFQCDYIVDPNDVGKIYNMLGEIHKDWKEKKLKVTEKDKIQNLHRKEQVNLLLSFLNEKNGSIK